MDHLWGEESIGLLIREYKERRSQHEGPITDEFWDEIVAALKKEKHRFTREQVAFRWNMLIVTLKKHKDSEKPEEQFTFYSEMKEFENEEVNNLVVMQGSK